MRCGGLVIVRELAGVPVKDERAALQRALRACIYSAHVAADAACQRGQELACLYACSPPFPGIQSLVFDSVSLSAEAPSRWNLWKMLMGVCTQPDQLLHPCRACRRSSWPACGLKKVLSAPDLKGSLVYDSFSGSAKMRSAGIPVSLLNSCPAQSRVEQR